MKTFSLDLRTRILAACDKHDSTRQHVAEREAWWERSKAWDPARVVFLDEAGVTTKMTRLYGRSMRGERARDSAPHGHWCVRTLIGSIRGDGRTTCMTIDAPTDNDGRRVLYNSRLMSYCTEEVQRFYIAQQLLHLRLNHYDRGRGRDRMVWRRAADAVVNRMLREEGFQLPMNATLLADDTERSAEEYYDIILAGLREIGDPDPTPELNPDDPRNKPRPQQKPKPGKSTEGAAREIEDPGLASAVRGLSGLLEPSFQLDFDWFPGDTVRDGVLPWQFRAVPVAHAEVLLDTSASVDTDLLRAF